MKIFVTRNIPGDHLKDLTAKGYEVSVSDFDRPLTQEELITKAKGVDALLSLLTDHVTGEVMDAIGPSLKIVSNYAVGFDNVDVAAATARGIIVTNTPSQEVNEAVAQHTIALMMAVARRIVEADEATKKGAYNGWEPDLFLGISLLGKTLGVIGLGNIGTMVARYAKALGMQVIYNKRESDPKAESELGIKFELLNDLLGRSDVVSLHVPLTPQTRHMINKDTLARMKQNTILVNTARGPIVDEHALVAALRLGHLAGAALDVFDNEPNVNPELVGMANVVLTPHIASATWEAREKMGSQAVDAILKVLSDEMPENLVDKDVWLDRRS